MKKIFCFFVILAFLMSAMPTSIFAMTSNVTNASGMDETVLGTHEDSNVFSHVKAISLTSTTVSEAPKEEWNKTFGSTGDDEAWAVQQTDDGGYVLAGDTLFETGLCTAWLVKTNSQGEKEWEKRFGITGFDSLSSVQQTTDGGYILAGDTLSSDAGLTAAWLVKTNSKGEKE
jgi:hypothetical protein